MDFALAAGESGKPCFCEVLSESTDPYKLWLDWACQRPKAERYPWRKSPIELRSDRELMLAVIAQEEQVMKHVGRELAVDIEFVTSALELNILALGYLQKATLRSFPHLISIDRLAKYKAAEGNDPNRLVQKIAENYWHDRTFVEGWLSVGFDLHPKMAPQFQDDMSILSLHAMNFEWETFIEKSKDKKYKYPRNLISENTITNKGTVRSLLLSGALAQPLMNLARYTTARLDLDYELNLLASYKTHSYEPGFSCLVKMIAQYKEYQGFFQGLLCGATEGSGSPLAILDQGTDTTIKRIIASFLDFPKGELLTWLLEAGFVRGLPGFIPT